MLYEQETRKHVCCFTGHRPENLKLSGWEINTLLETAISEAINDGFTTFITGMGRGADIWAAEAVLRLRAAGHPLRLICASPFDGFEEPWREEWRLRYWNIWVKSSDRHYICPAYSPDCFRRCNEWMVDRSARVIALYNGGEGGTRSTIDYARAKGVPVIVLPADGGGGNTP